MTDEDSAMRRIAFLLIGAGLCAAVAAPVPKEPATTTAACVASTPRP